jgi:hypothetical protein
MAQRSILEASNARNCPQKTRRRNCFESRKHALRAASWTRRQTGLKIIVYRCLACGLYHMGKRKLPPS